MKISEKLTPKPDPLFSLKLGPRAGFTITENDDWIGLPAGTYKLDIRKMVIEGFEETPQTKPVYFVVAVKQDD